MAAITSEHTFPGQQQEATPVPEPVEPPHLTMGMAVGRGLTDIGEELHRVGWESYQRAAEAQAQEKETEFQTKALKLRDQYRNRYLFDAVKAHDGVSGELEQARQEIANSVTSKHGRLMYMNNSLRGMRYVQESVDSHFETQNRAYQEKSYADLQRSDVDLLVAKGQDDSYNSKSVEEILQRMHGRAIDYATSRGFDAASAEIHANLETQKGTSALFSILSHKNNLNRNLTESEVKKYEERGWIDKGAARDALNTLGAANAKSWARNAFVGLSREDGNHDPDPEGFVPHSAVEKLANDKIAADDPRRGEKIDALESEWKFHNEVYKQAGDELRRSVMSQGMKAGGGRFVVPNDSLDWQKFQRLHGDLAAMISNRAADRDWQAWHRGRVSAHEASREAAGSVRYYLDKLSSEEQKAVTPEAIETLMMKSYHGPGMEAHPEDKARVLEYLKKLQTGKTDPVERQFGQISSQALEEAYKGNKQLVRAAMNRAYYFLDDEYSDSVRKGKPKSAAELREALVSEFNKKDGIFGTSIFGKRAGESYQRRGGIQAINGADDVKGIPVGTRYRLPGDPPNTWRTKH